MRTPLAESQQQQPHPQATHPGQVPPISMPTNTTMPQWPGPHPWGQPSQMPSPYLVPHGCTWPPNVSQQSYNPGMMAPWLNPPPQQPYPPHMFKEQPRQLDPAQQVLHTPLAQGQAQQQPHQSSAHRTPAYV